MAASALLQAGQRSAAITREALKIGTCYFCVGALLGVRQPTFYALPSSEAHSGLAEYLDAVSIPAQGAQPLQQQDTKTTCPVCLGILQHHDLQHDATCANKTSPRPAGAAAAEPAAHAGSGTPNSPAVALANAIRSKHYDSRRFFIGVRVPTSVAMRQHALRAFVCNQLGLDAMPGQMLSVKEAVRSRILVQLAAITADAAWVQGGGAGPLVEDGELKTPVQSQIMDGAALAAVGLAPVASDTPPLGEQPEGGLRLQVHFVHAAGDAELQGLKCSRTAGMSLLAAHQAGAAAGAGEEPPKSKRSRTTRDNRFFTAPSHKDVADALEDLKHTEMPVYVPGLVPLHWLPASLPNEQGYAVPPLPPSLSAPPVTHGPAPLHEYMEWRRQHYTGSPADLGKGVGSGGDLRLRLYTTDKTHTFPPCPPAVQSTSVFQVDAMRTPVYLTGRYNKLQRGVSQSPWGFAPSAAPPQGTALSPKDTQFQSDGIRQDTDGVPDERSVSECVASVLRAALGAPAGSSNFSAAGREDIDVRMLGSGRPFAIEITDACRTVLSSAAVDQLQGLINSNSHGVRVSGLRVAAPAEYTAMQKGAEEKQKTYAALVWCNVPLDEVQLAAAVDCDESQLIKQSTPVRVMHRRALMLRERHVLRRRAQWLDPHFFVLHLTTTAGAYVKEFVHGDLGRSSPSLADLMAERLQRPAKQVQCDIATLDVVDVAFAQGGIGAASAVWGQDLPEVTQEAKQLVLAAHDKGLLHHPILGSIPK